jgi:hypothetical protein
MRGQRIYSAVAPALALAVARNVAPLHRQKARKTAALRPMPGALWSAEQVTGEGGATPPSGRLPRPGCAQRVRPVGSLPLRPWAVAMTPEAAGAIHGQRMVRAQHRTSSEALHVKGER